MINYSFSVAELEFFMLIFCRISCFIFIAPFYSMNNTPSRIKIGLSFLVSVLLYTTMGEMAGPVYDSIYGYAALVLKEAATGLLLGYGCSICTGIVGFAGRIIDMETGLSMASMMDPTTKEDMSISGLWYQYAVMLVLIVSGMYQYIMKALAESFQLIPVGAAKFPTDGLLKVMLQFMADYILIAFRICLPMFAVMIILNAILGILTKVAPQMNMFSVGMQMKVLVGFLVLFITIGMLPNISDMVFKEMKIMMVAFVEAMM